jgi:hypothetical protein
MKTSQSASRKTSPKSDESPANSQDQLLAALKNGQSQLKKAPQVRGEATNAKRLLFMSEASKIFERLDDDIVGRLRKEKKYD